VKDAALDRRSIDLGAHGRTFATRSRAREIAEVVLDGLPGNPCEMVLDLNAVGLASPAFLDEFIGAMAETWPTAKLVVRGPERLVKSAVALGERRGLRASAAQEPGA